MFTQFFLKPVIVNGQMPEIMYDKLQASHLGDDCLGWYTFKNRNSICREENSTYSYSAWVTGFQPDVNKDKRFKINCTRFADKSLHIRKESELPESLDAAECCSGKEESKPVSKVRLTNRHDCTRMNRASFENTDGTHICKISPRRPANRAFTATCRWSTYMENIKQCILVQGSAVQYLHRFKESRAKRIV